MEQKTEASQAVDERADMIAALSMCAAALAQGSSKRSRDIACEYACEALRLAALEAQPAPTEAAQGEDSARLDAERIEFDAAAFETAIGEAPNRIITDKTPWGWRYRRAAMQDEFMEFRARASAETGGVKP